jgi:hypothetical protein
VISKAEWELRQRQWTERTQTPRDLTPEECLAALGALYEILPESTRAEEQDSEKHGVIRMHELLRLLSTQ